MSLFTNRSNVGGVIYKMLRCLGKPVLFNTIQDELDTHPDYDTLLAVTDVLTHFGVSSLAYRITNADLQQVPVPFIANTQKKGSEFLLITQVSTDYLTTNNGNGPSGKISRQKFSEIFSGVVLAIDQENVVVQAGSTLKQNTGSVAEELRYPVAFLLLTMILLVSIATRTQYLSNLTWPYALLLLFKSAGVITSMLLLVQSIDQNNPLIQKLCGSGGGKTNCNAILSSKAAVVFEGLSWSEVGFFYFTGTWLALLFGHGSTTLLQALALLNLVSLPYTFYSIYYQYKVAKQWCTLCCTVQSLLWLEFAAFVSVSPGLFKGNAIDGSYLNTLSSLFICLTLPVALWLLLKPLFLKAQQLKPLKNQIRKLKYNKEFFNNLLQAQPKYAIPDAGWSIVLGNVKADNIIAMVSHLFCRPCAKAHKILHELLNKQIDIQVRIIFTAKNEEKDIQTPIVKHLMTLNKLNNKPLMLQALHDWYEKEPSNYEEWAKKYPVSLLDSGADILNIQESWCKMAEVKYTPSLYINGNLLPEQYWLSEIKYMLV